MRKLLLLGAALLLIPASAIGLDWVGFTVTQHVDNTTFTANIMDNAMNDVNDRLKYDNHNCTDDVPCSVRVSRSGTVGTFGTINDGLDVITTQAELDDVFDVTTHRIKVVTAVNFCAGGFNPAIIGCGVCDADGFIVEDWVDGTVYVHEYGHNVMGCGHRNDCADNIMNAVSIGTNNSVNFTECSGFGGEAYNQIGGYVCNGYWGGFPRDGPLTVNRGPYWVTSDATVPAGEELTVEAGVEIQFQFGLRIKSNGYTHFEGSANRITIYSNNDNINFPTAIVDGELIIQNGGELILH